MGRRKEYDYITHVCLNSRLDKSNRDYCDRGFVDICPTRATQSEQCWKYCPECEAKGYPKIFKKPIDQSKVERGKKLQARLRNKDQ